MLKVADEVFVAVGLLHREHPEQEDFSIGEIVDRAEAEKLTPRLRPGVRVHVTTHSVAGLPPNPGRYTTLTATSSGRRRLFRPGDPVHPARVGGKQLPAEGDLPASYRPLLTWYATEYLARGSRERVSGVDPFLELRGLGREIWADESGDEFIDKLRSEW